MRTIVLGLVLFVELIIQGTILQFFDYYGYHPDITLITVICLSIIYKKEYAYKLGLIAGILTDILYGGVFGFYALSFLLTAYLVGTLSKNIYIETYFAPLVVFPVGAIVFNSMTYFLEYLLRTNIPIGDYIQQFGLLYWIINILFVIIIYPVTLKIVNISNFKSQKRI